MAVAITEKLRLKLTGAQQQQLAKRPTTNAQAWDLFLTGMFYASSGGWSGSRQRAGYRSRSRFAQAYGSMSIAYLNLATAVSPGLSSSESTEKARAAAERAIALDPQSPAAHNALAMIKVTQWRM